ncbi:hypothetical protein SS50377_22924 [Spironucleus salmonicida]|uniref:Uncharacterized protein n=1 Tax=Spironucleus salmonicida TaxID=348837 RepID=V6M5Y8_9EUKA|nr:hypothetical protein SS50377_22924 [Spironucleus salmonicida]|eukprot:EST48769.1 Hypothetical protein SS50377_11093 [Spironucleus salmonicida]
MDSHARIIQDLITERFDQYQEMIENRLKTRKFFLINDLDLPCNPETDHLEGKSVLPIFQNFFGQKILIQDQILKILQSYSDQTHANLKVNLSDHVKTINFLTSNSLKLEVENQKLTQQNSSLNKKLNRLNTEFTKLKSQKIEQLKQYMAVGQMYVPDAENKEVMQPFKPSTQPIGKSVIKWDKGTEIGENVHNVGIAGISPTQPKNLNFQQQKDMQGFEKDLQTEDIVMENIKLQEGTQNINNQSIFLHQQQHINSDNKPSSGLILGQTQNQTLDTNMFTLKKALKLLGVEGICTNLQGFVDLVQRHINNSKTKLENDVTTLKNKQQQQFDQIESLKKQLNKQQLLTEKASINLNQFVRDQALVNNEGSQSQQVVDEQNMESLRQQQNQNQSTILSSDQQMQQGMQFKFSPKNISKSKASSNQSNNSLITSQQDQDDMFMKVTAGKQPRDVNSLKKLPKHRSIGEIETNFLVQNNKDNSEHPNLSSGGKISLQEENSNSTIQHEKNYSGVEHTMNFNNININANFQHQNTEKDTKPRKQLDKKFSFAITEQSKLAFQFNESGEQPLQLTSDFDFKNEKKQLYRDVNENIMERDLGNGLKTLILKHGAQNPQSGLRKEPTALNLRSPDRERHGSNQSILGQPPPGRCDHGVQCYGDLSKDLVNSCDCERAYKPRLRVVKQKSGLDLSCEDLLQAVQIKCNNEEEIAIKMAPQIVAEAEPEQECAQSFEIVTKSFGKKQELGAALGTVAAQKPAMNTILPQEFSINIQAQNGTDDMGAQPVSKQLNVRIPAKTIQRQKPQPAKSKASPRQSLQSEAENIEINELDVVRNILNSNNFQALQVAELSQSKIKPPPKSNCLPVRSRPIPKIPQKIEFDDCLYQDKVQKMKLDIQQKYDTTGYNYDRKDGADFIHRSKYQKGNVK